MKKYFKVLTTAALVSTLTISGFGTESLAKQSDSKESVTAKSNINVISNIVFKKDNELVSVPFTNYIVGYDNASSLNGYNMAYLVKDGAYYGISDYAVEYEKGDAIDDVLKRLQQNNKEKTLDSNSIQDGAFLNGKLVSTSSNTLSTPQAIDTNSENIILTEKGTYGGTNSVPQVIEGNVTIASDKVNLSNVIIKGNLTIAESVDSGDVIIDNTKVEGNTYIKGGGLHSVHFQDSVIATVIVNKNDGKVRVVVSGESTVQEVRLESYAKLEEENLDTGSEGFTDVLVDPTVQRVEDGLEEVEFIGQYNTINSKAQRVKIKLSEDTSVEKIALDAIAHVLGNGYIKNAEINQNASGSVFDQSLDNVVLNNGASITANGQEISESVSSAAQTEVLAAKLTPDSVGLNFENYVANISANDFDIEATIDGAPVELEDLTYKEDMQRLFFTPVVNENNIGKKLKVKVTPKGKLTGQPITTNEVDLQEGFSGRVTTIQNVGMPNVNIEFYKEDTNESVTNTVTDKFGYYFVYAPAGSYRGMINGNNVVTTNLYAYVSNNLFNVNQNETAIATAASSELKIVVDWDKYPLDVDSHLVGMSNDRPFHVFYGNKVLTENNNQDDYDYDSEYDYENYAQSIIDLDWDDTRSYGPETTTFRKLSDGQYIFYLNNFSGNYDSYDEQLTTLANSKAVIKIYKGDSVTATKTIKIEDLKSDSKDTYFYAYGIEISNNGQDINIIPIEKFDNTIDEIKLANLKEYLPTLLSDYSYLLLEGNVDSENYLKFKEAYDVAQALNISTASFEELLNATLTLKITVQDYQNEYYNNYYDYE